jgi:hypothetical protein
MRQVKFVEGAEGWIEIWEDSGGGKVCLARWRRITSRATDFWLNLGCWLQNGSASVLGSCLEIGRPFELAVPPPSMPAQDDPLVRAEKQLGAARSTIASLADLQDRVQTDALHGTGHPDLFHGYYVSCLQRFYSAMSALLDHSKRSA